MCANCNPPKRGNTSHVKSIVGMYIRGEKNLSDIVHPSKITQKPNDSSQSQRVKSTPHTTNQQAKAICPAHKSISVNPSFQTEEDCTATQRATEPIKITSINRIQFEGDDMVIRLKPTSESSENMSSRMEKIECSIHSCKRNQQLDFSIRPTNDCVVSEMSLKNRNLKQSVNQADSGDNEQTKSTASDSNESRSTFSGRPYLGASNVNAGSNLCAQTTRSCGNSQSLSSSTKTCQHRKSTVEAAGEHKPLNELTKEIRKAEQLLDEYETERRERMAEEAVATVNPIRPEDIEGLLKEFSNGDENSDSAIALSNAGLNHLMADYFREYYNDLRRKIAQFSRERVALLMVIDNLKSDRSKLQTDVEFLRRKLHKDKICKDEICTVSAAPWNCK